MEKTEAKVAAVPVKFVAVATYYWGRGMTVEEALKQLRAAGFRGRMTAKNVRIATLPDGATDAYVDSMGSVCWTHKGEGRLEWSSVEEARARK